MTSIEIQSNDKMELTLTKTSLTLLQELQSVSKFISILLLSSSYDLVNVKSQLVQISFISIFVQSSAFMSNFLLFVVYLYILFLWYVKCFATSLEGGWLVAPFVPPRHGSWRVHQARVTTLSGSSQNHSRCPLLVPNRDNRSTEIPRQPTIQWYRVIFASSQM